MLLILYISDGKEKEKNIIEAQLLLIQIVLYMRQNNFKVQTQGNRNEAKFSSKTSIYV